jgi:hypothetical protein
MTPALIVTKRICSTLIDNYYRTVIAPSYSDYAQIVLQHTSTRIDASPIGIETSRLVVIKNAM